MMGWVIRDAFSNFTSHCALMDSGFFCSDWSQARSFANEAEARAFAEQHKLGTVTFEECRDLERWKAEFRRMQELRESVFGPLPVTAATVIASEIKLVKI